MPFALLSNVISSMTASLTTVASTRINRVPSGKATAFAAVAFSAVTLLLAALSPVASAQTEGQVQILDKVVAIVDDDIVLASELQERLLLIEKNLERQGVDVSDRQRLVRETLDRLIIESIQLQLANRYGIRISDAQLDDAMQRMAAQNGSTLEEFRQKVEAEGQSYAAMREEIRREMRISRVQQGNVNRNIEISEQEIDNFMATEEGETMTQPEYRVVQALLEVKSSDTASTKADKKQFVEGVHAAILDGQPFQEAVATMEPYVFTGGDLGWRKAAQLPSIFAEVVPSLDTGDTALVESGAGYHLLYLVEARGRERLVQQTKVRHILIKPTEVLNEEGAGKLVAALRERILAGEDFEVLAKEYSDDIGSAQEGGELGWTNPGQMVPEFEAMMASTDPGEISEPFQSQFGWHILEVQDRREKDFANEVRRNQVMRYLHDQKYDEELDAWLRKIREEAFVDIK